MYFDSKKNLGIEDKEVIYSVREKLRDGSFDNRAEGRMRLNELIFTLEGLLNLEKADARAYKTKGVDYYQIPVNVDEISSDGEVWISDEDFLLTLEELRTAIVELETEAIKMIDLDVMEINSSVVVVRIVALRSEPLDLDIHFSWFNESESYPAMGPESLAGESFTDPTCYDIGQPYMLPCVIDYPSITPYPAWVRINEKLNLYYNLFTPNSAQANTPNFLLNVNKVWFTNVLNPNLYPTFLNGWTMYSPSIQCSMGRMDRLYMAGNWNSQWTSGAIEGPGGCGCINAPDPVLAPQVCGEYVYIHSMLADEMLDDVKMNKYLQTCIDHINARFDFYSQAGMVDAIASIEYFAITYTDPTYYGTGLTGAGDQRYHGCRYYLGTANYY